MNSKFIFSNQTSSGVQYVNVDHIVKWEGNCWDPENTGSEVTLSTGEIVHVDQPRPTKQVSYLPAQPGEIAVVVDFDWKAQTFNNYHVGIRGWCIYAAVLEMEDKFIQPMTTAGGNTSYKIIGVLDFDGAVTAPLKFDNTLITTRFSSESDFIAEATRVITKRHSDHLRRQQERKSKAVEE
jgi:hypothetical protein